MSTAVEAPATAGRKLGLGEVFIKGRIEAMRRYEGNFYTRLAMPAPDEFSKPQMVQVRGKGKLGQQGEIIQVLCRVGGYMRKPYQVTDDDSGETTTITPVDITLDVVE